MAEEFGFFDPVEIAPDVWDREYNAEQFTKYFKALVTTGIMKGTSGELKVIANGSNMNIDINVGVAFIEGRYYNNTANLTHTLDTESLGRSRIDRIIIRMDLNERWVKSFVKKGVASATPVAPTLTQTANVYEISLAQVKIVGGQTYISVANVVNERGTDVICPWAGSNILPNFDDANLAALVEAVQGIRLNDGTDLNNVLANGLYFYDSATILNRPTSSMGTEGWIVQVFNDDDGTIIQHAYTTNPTQVAGQRRGRSRAGVWNAWKSITTQISDQLNLNSSDIAASSLAVKTLNDAKANKIQQTPLTVNPMNGWSAITHIKYYKDEFGIVRVTGAIMNGSATEGVAIFLLPVGYRPSALTSSSFVLYTSNLSGTKNAKPLEVYFSDGACFLSDTSLNKIVIDISFKT